ncbi:HAD family hydrolase [Orrella daihaiensis]|uniref:HAD-IA family hydrolase n=1 Tax=Orrella daihaiensis TaxID=2782176 RepID=A0ABY4AKA1_9BURK|nr:HAD-IA family hydrolase [Orrella daihaiensis]UOD49820.1 HAD-IA family hydrolase [Orrella daihaiensis]
MTRLVLFDFDGTFADTAPDMAAAANRLRLARGMPALPIEQLRPFVSMGARGMVKASLGFEPDHPEFEDARVAFLADYEQNSTTDTVIFEGISELLDNIRTAQMRWGIVTNKHTRYAEPIVAWLNLPDCATLVCGDTLEFAKPHPLPLRHAAKEAGFETHECFYVGDDIRDIQAAQAAGMPSIAAAYGYCGTELPVHSWGADAIVDHPSLIWDVIQNRISRS